LFKKYASATILDARMGQDSRGMMKNAHRAVFDYTPRPGYLYVRSRAISSRCNDNFDMFPAEEIAKSYRTFIGKPVFVNHHNEDHRRARGMIIDAVLHRDVNPDGSPDTWAEVLHEIDAVKFPKLAKAIIAKEVDRTSMGCDVEFSKCSACGNVATSPLQYCAHIPGKKGKRLVTGKVASNGRKETKLVFEICSGLSFFENSLLVEAPADPTAYFLGEVEYGPGLEAFAKAAAESTVLQTSSVRKDNSWPAASSQIPVFRKSASLGNNSNFHSIWNLLKQATETEEKINAAEEGLKNDHVRSFEGRAVPDHGESVAVYRDLSGAPKSGYPARGSWSIKRLSPRGGRSPHVYAHTVGLHVTDAQPVFDEGARQHFKEEEKRGVHAYIGGKVHHYAEPLEAGQQPEGDGWRQVSYYPDISHFFMKDTRNKYHGSNEAAFRGGSMWARGDIQEGDDGPVPQSKFERPKTGKLWELLYTAVLTDDDLDDEWFRTARKPSKADEYLAKNPVNVNHILARVRAASPEQFHAGMNWYKDAHEIAKGMATHHDKPLHTVAGVLGVYSGQTAVAPNFHYASQSFRSGKGVHADDTGEDWDSAHKPFASGGQAHKVDRLLSGEHYEDVMDSPKTHHYARLIHNPDNNHDVVVDRHAVAAALGHERTTDAAYKGVSGGLKKTTEGSDHPVYEHFAQAYRDAANHLTHELRSSGHIGENDVLQPHHAQAISWIVQKQMNDAATDDNPRTRAMAKKNAYQVKSWTQHYNKVYPHAHQPDHPDYFWGKESRKLAYGETKAPQDVDTLRSESCTVCGNSTAFDGTQCQVCGYLAPPRPFGDPDTDTARNNDLRKDVLDSDNDMADPNDPDQQLGNQTGDPDELEDQADEAAVNTQNTLTCNNCGMGVIPPPATSEGGEPPYPAEGDVCPACKKGQFDAADSNGEAEEDVDGDGVPDDEEEPDPSGDEKNPFGSSDESDSDEDEDDDEDEEKKGKEKKP
jgi:hypothetical protein